MKEINKHENHTHYYVIICKSIFELKKGNGEIIPPGTEFSYEIQYANRMEIRYYLWMIDNNGWNPLRIEDHLMGGIPPRFFCLPQFYPACHRKLASRWNPTCTGYKKIIKEHPELRDWKTNRKCTHCATMNKSCS